MELRKFENILPTQHIKLKIITGSGGVFDRRKEGKRKYLITFFSLLFLFESASCCSHRTALRERLRASGKVQSYIVETCWSRDGKCNYRTILGHTSQFRHHHKVRLASYWGKDLWSKTIFSQILSYPSFGQRWFVPKISHKMNHQNRMRAWLWFSLINKKRLVFLAHWYRWDQPGSFLYVDGFPPRAPLFTVTSLQLPKKNFSVNALNAMRERERERGYPDYNAVLTITTTVRCGVTLIQLCCICYKIHSEWILKLFMQKESPFLFL